MKAVESRPGIWRVGEVLITAWDAQLDPKYCVKCCAESDGEVVMLVQPHQGPLTNVVHLVLQPSTIVGLIAERFGKRVTVGVYICERHRKWRNRLILATKFLAIAGVLIFVLNLPFYRDFYLGVFGGFLFAASLDLLPFAERILKVDHYNKKYVYFLGAGSAYLSKLPTMPMELRCFD